MTHELVRLLFIAWNGVNFLKQVETILDYVRLFFDRLDDVPHSFEQPNYVEVSQLRVIVLPRRILDPQMLLQVLNRCLPTCFSLTESLQLVKMDKISERKTEMQVLASLWVVKGK